MAWHAPTAFFIPCGVVHVEVWKPAADYVTQLSETTLFFAERNGWTSACGSTSQEGQAVALAMPWHGLCALTCPYLPSCTYYARDRYPIQCCLLLYATD
jgi:hypothetical protein